MPTIIGESVLPILLVKLVGVSGRLISLHSKHKVSGDVVNMLRMPGVEYATRTKHTSINQ